MHKAPSPKAGCSASSWGESIVGSAPVENAYLILELAKPWPKKIKAEGAVAEFKPLLKGAKEEVKLLATPRIDWLPLCQRPFALLVRWSQGQALVQELPARPEDVKAALEGPPAGQPTPLYLVCTHGTRDRCCGSLGFPVYRSLLEKSQRKVLQVSHLGGHRYAPVVMALPEWRFFGHMDSDTCLEMDQTLNQGQSYLTGYRGKGRLPEYLQPIEAGLWEKHGSALKGIRRISGDQDSRMVIVRAVLHDGNELAYEATMAKQELHGFKSCVDMDGKEKTITLPSLAALEEISLASAPLRQA